MKLFLLFFLSLIFVAAATIDQTVKTIRSKYEKIKQLEPKMKVEKHDQASGQSAEGSKSEIYKHNGEIKEIREEYFDEYGKAKYFYYFEKAQVFFVFLEEARYSLPLMQPVPGLPKPTKTRIEHRYYFEGEKLIKWINTGKSVTSSTNDFKEQQEKILSGAKKAFIFASSSK